jgi:hypothetical protein
MLTGNDRCWQAMTDFDRHRQNLRDIDRHWQTLTGTDRIWHWQTLTLTNTDRHWQALTEPDNHWQILTDLNSSIINMSLGRSAKYFGLSARGASSNLSWDSVHVQDTHWCSCVGLGMFKLIQCGIWQPIDWSYYWRSFSSPAQQIPEQKDII